MFKTIVHPPITVGLAAYGMSGKVFHGPLLRIHPGFKVTKIVERSKKLSSADFPQATIVAGLEELLTDPALDLIVINTPDHTHYDYTKAALEAGKHVVVEKPFVQQSTQGEELIALAERHGLLLTVFQNRRWDNDFLTVRAVIEQQLLGRLVEFESHYDRYRNYIQADTWKEDPDLGASIVYNLGSHLIDQALCLFGPPEAVQADIRSLRTNGQVDDFFDIDLFYPAVKVKLKSSYLTREPGPRFILHGTEGSFLKWGLDPQEDRLKSGDRPDAPDWGTESEAQWGRLNTNLGKLHVRGRVETVPGNYPAFYELVYAVLTRGETPAVPARESLLGIRIIEAALESQRKGERILL